MNATHKPTTLAERIYCLLAKDDAPDGRGMLSRCHKPVQRQLGGGFMTPHEVDLMDWGLVYGLAFGLARVDDPCESEESVAERAETAARAAYEQWGGGLATIKRPEIEPHIQKVADAWGARGPSCEIPGALEEALDGLVGAAGTSGAEA